tara:strand:+ start:884 stop:1108 length:225 start_codon:yes stop_codon:yes gene_type:complete
MSNKKTNEVIENVSHAIESRQQIALDAIELIMWMNKRVTELNFEVHKFRKEADEKINHFMDISSMIMDESRSEE